MCIITATADVVSVFGKADISKCKAGVGDLLLALTPPYPGGPVAFRCTETGTVWFPQPPGPEEIAGWQWAWVEVGYTPSAADQKPEARFVRKAFPRELKALTDDLVEAPGTLELGKDGVFRVSIGGIAPMEAMLSESAAGRLQRENWKPGESRTIKIKQASLLALQGRIVETTLDPKDTRDSIVTMSGAWVGSDDDGGNGASRIFLPSPKRNSEGALVDPFLPGHYNVFRKGKDGLLVRSGATGGFIWQGSVSHESTVLTRVQENTSKEVSLTATWEPAGASNEKTLRLPVPVAWPWTIKRNSDGTA